MYGNLLPPEPRGQVGAGLGMTTSTGTVTLIPPTVYVRSDGQEETIDGLKFHFLLAPGSEAPSEMHWFLPQLKALTVAENACHTQHNLYSLRAPSSASAGLVQIPAQVVTPVGRSPKCCTACITGRSGALSGS